jgi:hypothetical protein
LLSKRGFALASLGAVTRKALSRRKHRLESGRERHKINSLVGCGS